MTRSELSTSIPKKRARHLLLEAYWLFILALALALLACLFTYHPQDPGWSHLLSSNVIHNFGGRVGAWGVDLLLFVFGFSAYWWCVLLLRYVYLGWRELYQNDVVTELYHCIVVGCGFSLLLSASVALEALRFYRFGVLLPGDAGGVLGHVIAVWLQHLMGFNGATLLLLLLFAIGLSWFFQFSWLTLVERLGEWFENRYLATRDFFEARRDRQVGQQAAAVRDENLAEQRIRVDEVPPVQIVRAPTTVVPHQKVEQEKQRALFSEMQQDTSLPPFHYWTKRHLKKTRFRHRRWNLLLV